MNVFSMFLIFISIQTEQKRKIMDDMILFVFLFATELMTRQHAVLEGDMVQSVSQTSTLFLLFETL